MLTAHLDAIWRAKYIGPTTKMACLAIMQHINTQDQWAYPSEKRLAQMTGYSIATIKREVKRLRLAGIIQTKMKRDKDAQWPHQCYKFTNKLNGTNEPKLFPSNRIKKFSRNSKVPLKIQQYAQKMHQFLPEAEYRFWRAFGDKLLGYKLDRQHPVRCGDKWYIIDFYCARAKIAIEVDGPEHTEEYNNTRDNLLFQCHKIKTLRIKNEDVLNDPNCMAMAVLAQIRRIHEGLPVDDLFMGAEVVCKPVS
jgi:very-short-patch-repair endonuclease